MEDEAQLVVTDVADQTVLIPTEAHTLKAAALESSALIFKVDSKETHDAAVDAQKKLLGLKRRLEKAREAAKRPLLDIGKKIDQAVREFTADIDEEGNRVAGLVNEYIEAQRIREAAEKRLQDAELSRLQQERNEKLALAATVEQQDAINEEYSRKEQMAQMSTVEPTRAHGQVVRTDWEVIVSDVHALYRSHPNCVDLKPRLSEIKALLNAGVEVRGVVAKRSAKATVRGV